MAAIVTSVVVVFFVLVGALAVWASSGYAIFGLRPWPEPEPPPEGTTVPPPETLGSCHPLFAGEALDWLARLKLRGPLAVFVLEDPPRLLVEVAGGFPELRDEHLTRHVAALSRGESCAEGGVALLPLISGNRTLRGVLAAPAGVAPDQRQRAWLLLLGERLAMSAEALDVQSTGRPRAPVPWDAPRVGRWARRGISS